MHLLHEHEVPVIEDDVSSELYFGERRPVTVRDISEALGLHENEVIKYLETLSESGEVKAEQFEENTYYHG